MPWVTLPNRRGLKLRLCLFLFSCSTSQVITGILRSGFLFVSSRLSPPPFWLLFLAGGLNPFLSLSTRV